MANRQTRYNEGMEHIIKSSRHPGDVVYITGHASYVCMDVEDNYGSSRAHLHLTVKESRKLRKALKAAERGD